jgi:hypothetical protein
VLGRSFKSETSRASEYAIGSIEWPEVQSLNHPLAKSAHGNPTKAVENTCLVGRSRARSPISSRFWKHPMAAAAKRWFKSHPPTKRSGSPLRSWERPRLLWVAPVKNGAEGDNEMFNNVTLIGYLGSDAESRTTRNTSTLTVLSLATKRI